MIDCHHYQKAIAVLVNGEMPYEQQLAKKEEHLKQLAKLDCDNLIWHPPLFLRVGFS